MAITRPTGVVSTTAWGFPVTDEVNRLTTESGNTKDGITNANNDLAQYLQPTWIPLALATGWVPFGGTQTTPAYALFGDWVYLRGLVKNNTGAAFSGTGTFANLPADVRPWNHVLVSVLESAGSATFISCRLNFNSTGVCTVYVDASHAMPNAQWFSLEGQYFNLT